MSTEVLIAFFVSSLLLALAPGPDNIFVLTQSAIYGARSGALVVLGLCTGLVFHTALVTLGISAIIVANEYLFLAVKAAGALYLLYLAWGAFRAKPSGGGGEAVALSPRALYLRGVVMNGTNPKVIIFFLAFFPQFVAKGAGSGEIMVQMLVQGLLFMAATFLVFNAIALLAGQLKTLTRSPRFEIYLNRIAGLIFVGLAVSALLVTAN